MTSVNTNVAAQTALRTLQSTNAQLDQTQNRISTGLKIAEAKDNAAYWSISTTLKSDSRSLTTVQDALSLGAATVDTAYQGTNQVRVVLEDLQNKIILASGGSADKTALQAEITQLQQNLRAIASSAGFSGENWLAVNSGATGYSDQKSIVSSFNREQSGGVTLDTIAIDASGFVLIDSDATGTGILDTGVTNILNLDVSDADATEVAGFRDLVVTALGQLTDNASTLGAIAKRIELQETFVSKLIDTIDKGVSGLVDADMNEESTRLQALQVKQQLGVQALSIANQSAQNVLSLFR